MSTQANDQLAKPSAGGLPSRGTILCVFTEDGSVAAYEAALSRRGYTLIRARHGMHGYWLSINARPDVILTDLVKPDDESSYLLDCLARNAKTSHIPVVAIVDQLKQNQPGISCLRGLTSCFLSNTKADALIDELDRLVALRPQPQPTPTADHISRFDAFFADLGHATPKPRWGKSPTGLQGPAGDSNSNQRSIDPAHRSRRRPAGRRSSEAGVSHAERLGTRSPVRRD
jgi:CheY-like chemotaxis protein